MVKITRIHNFFGRGNKCLGIEFTCLPLSRPRCWWWGWDDCEGWCCLGWCFSYANTSTFYTGQSLDQWLGQSFKLATLRCLRACSYYHLFQYSGEFVHQLTSVWNMRCFQIIFFCRSTFLAGQNHFDFFLFFQSSSVPFVIVYFTGFCAQDFG